MENKPEPLTCESCGREIHGDEVHGEDEGGKTICEDCLLNLNGRLDFGEYH